MQSLNEADKVGQVIPEDAAFAASLLAKLCPLLTTLQLGAWVWTHPLFDPVFYICKSAVLWFLWDLDIVFRKMIFQCKNAT